MSSESGRNLVPETNQRPLFNDLYVKRTEENQDQDGNVLKWILKK